MAKLRADKRNYKKAFTVHANSYDNWNIGILEVLTVDVYYYVIVLNVD